MTDILASNKWEDFHEFLRAYVDLFTKNIYATTDNMYKHLKSVKTDPNVAVVSSYKESCAINMNKIDDDNKLQEMINDGIRNRIY